MKKIFSISAFILLVTFSGQVFADLNNKLNGEYAYTRSSYCLQNSIGFGSQLEPLGTAHIRNSTITGVWTFNGDGTATLQYKGVRIRNDRVDAGVGNGVLAFEGTCDATYQVNADLTVSVTPTCSSVTTAGTTSNLGGITETSGGQLTGFVKRKKLILSGVGTNVISGTFTRTDGAVFNIHRICTSAGNGFKR